MATAAILPTVAPAVFPSGLYVNSSGYLITDGRRGTIPFSAQNLQTATVTKTAAYTVTLADGTIRADATAGAYNVTLPTAASAYNAATGIGKIFVVKKIDASANAVTIKGNGAELIDGSNTKALSSQWTSARVQSNGTTWDVI